ncbi:hypothetical protein Y032_0047g1528 [Ancylostoma ceylanicum]|uniref:Uncharacterized protein n=1 Tax=Ancylostoma ceylanicum TaxID=53326 RepID=A0A016UD55_9BILA|nr:hypothetical protein Y032_0047g1528 [Ancylostoma ceylanicum]
MVILFSGHDERTTTATPRQLRREFRAIPIKTHYVLGSSLTVLAVSRAACITGITPGKRANTTQIYPSLSRAPVGNLSDATRATCVNEVTRVSALLPMLMTDESVGFDTLTLGNLSDACGLRPRSY